MNPPNTPQPLTPMPPQSAPPIPPAGSAEPQQPVVTPGANTMPVKPLPAAGPMKKKFNLPDMKQILEKIKKMPLKFKLMGGFVGILILLLIIVGFTAPGKKVKQLILPSPSPIPTLEPIGDVFEPSPYANDPEVLDLENKINDFDGKLGSTDLREDSLRVPNLDWDINFKQK